MKVNIYILIQIQRSSSMTSVNRYCAGSDLQLKEGQSITRTDGHPVPWHYSDAIMIAMASQITGVSIICSVVRSDADQRKHQSSVSLAFVSGIHQWPVDSPHKGPVTRKCVFGPMPYWKMASRHGNTFLITGLWDGNQFTKGHYFIDPWKMWQ